MPANKQNPNGFSGLARRPYRRKRGTRRGPAGHPDGEIVTDGQRQPKPEATQENIQTVAKLEQEFSEDRTAEDRVGDVVGKFAGSLIFVGLHIVYFSSWFLINSGALPGIQPFDHFPFNFLQLLVGIEAIFLFTFVLMRQNRMARQSEHRAHLGLQISWLDEKETTKGLQLIQEIARHLGIETAADDAEIEELAEDTHVENLAREVKQRLPAE